MISGMVFILRPHGAKYHTSPTMPLRPYEWMYVCRCHPFSNGTLIFSSSNTTWRRLTGLGLSVTNIGLKCLQEDINQLPDNKMFRLVQIETICRRHFKVHLK